MPQDEKKYAEGLAHYDAMLATHPEVERKGKNMLYTSVNGHMFTYYTQEAQLGMRLSKEDGAAFAEKYSSEPFIQHNTVMRGYVSIPDELLANTKELGKYLIKSYDYILSLKPKATKKKKKK